MLIALNIKIQSVVNMNAMMRYVLQLYAQMVLVQDRLVLIVVHVPTDLDRESGFAEKLAEFLKMVVWWQYATVSKGSKVHQG